MDFIVNFILTSKLPFRIFCAVLYLSAVCDTNYLQYSDSLSSPVLVGFPDFSSVTSNQGL